MLTLLFHRYQRYARIQKVLRIQSYCRYPIDGYCLRDLHHWQHRGIVLRWSSLRYLRFVPLLLHSLPLIIESNTMIGRRYGMMFGASFIILGTIVQATCTGLAGFMAGRFLLGFGVATSASAGPAYVSEMAHPAFRGTMVIAPPSPTFTLLYTDAFSPDRSLQHILLHGPDSRHIRHIRNKQRLPRQ